MMSWEQDLGYGWRSVKDALVRFVAHGQQDEEAFLHNMHSMRVLKKYKPKIKTSVIFRLAERVQYLDVDALLELLDAHDHAVASPICMTTICLKIFVVAVMMLLERQGLPYNKSDVQEKVIWSGVLNTRSVAFEAKLLKIMDMRFDGMLEVLPHQNVRRSERENAGNRKSH